MKVKQDLRAGRLNVKAVRGIGEPTAERLGMLGITSVPQLADAEADKLTGQLVQAGDDVTVGNVGNWIDQARRPGRPRRGPVETHRTHLQGAARRFRPDR